MELIIQSNTPIIYIYICLNVLSLGLCYCCCCNSRPFFQFDIRDSKKITFFFFCCSYHRCYLICKLKLLKDFLHQNVILHIFSIKQIFPSLLSFFLSLSFLLFSMILCNQKPTTILFSLLTHYFPRPLSSLAILPNSTCYFYLHFINGFPFC